MHKKTIIYRGNLKSCNYSCSYCPFAKHRALTAEMERDRHNFARFCDSIERRAQSFSIGAVFVTPYGEASIHPWYWEGLSRLAALPEIERVGMQTNLSFSVEECLKVFDSFGENNLETEISEREHTCEKLSEKKSAKLSIWATFHPEMTTVDEFVCKCHRLIQNGIMVCAGAVGVPENIQLLRKLREKLSSNVYLWINKMDGLKRAYRQDEINSFVEIDPFFEYELNNPETAAQMCTDRCFVEADGKLRSCNICRVKNINWYDGNESEVFEPLCSGKRCTCYLAYGGRADFALKNIFGDYPVFRIPKRFRAVFFDLDGTLIPTKKKCDAKGNGLSTVNEETDIEDRELTKVGNELEMSTGNRHGRGLSDQVRRKLTILRETCPIFLATSMPEADVKRRLKGDMGLFQGFIFASGGYLCLKNEKGHREMVYPVDVSSISKAIEYGDKVKARCVVSAKNGSAYKVTIIKKHHSRWTDEECSRIEKLLKKSNCRFFTEKNCLEIVSRGRDKGAGIEDICGWLGVPTEDALAVGNDKEDGAMERVCGGYMKVGKERLVFSCEAEDY